jgi:hypothetical protein
LTITGGEPTTEPRLEQILAAARRRGIRRFVLQTNAVALAAQERASRLFSLGVRDFFVSFHSYRPRVYDLLTGSREQFSLALAGIRNLLSLPSGRVTFNVVVNAANYRDLPGLIDFLWRQNITRSVRAGIFFSMMNDEGLRRAPSLAVALQTIAPRLNQAAESARRKGLRVIVFGGYCAIPVCLLKYPTAAAAKTPFPQHGVHYVESMTDIRVSCGRVKPSRCRACSFNSRCLGVPVGYARRFGLEALRAPTILP